MGSITSKKPGEAYAAGYHAGHNGFVIKNPYSGGSAHRRSQWVDGWKAGDADRKAGQLFVNDMAGAS
jgi:ribosome modulation factor